MRVRLSLRLSGYVRAALRGTYAARVLDAAAREGLSIGDIRALPLPGAELTVRAADFRTLAVLARRYACRLHILRRGGLPFALRRQRGRLLLPLGTLLCAAVFWALTGFIWTIEVTGARDLSDGQILRAAAAWGVRIGAPISGVYNEELRNGMLRELPALSWVTVRFEGSHAVVEVRERRVPPEVADDGEPCDIRASASGMVTMVRVRQGTAEVQKGSIVEAGDLLVSGTLRYRTDPGGWPETYGTAPVRADAEVWARVWQTARAAAPLEAFEKRRTGEVRTRWTLILGRCRIGLTDSAAFFARGCDILETRWDLSLLPGVRVPFGVVRETILPYDRVRTQADESALTDFVTAQARARLEVLTAGEALTVTDTRAETSGGAVRAAVSGETVRDIALAVRADAENETGEP